MVLKLAARVSVGTRVSCLGIWVVGRVRFRVRLEFGPTS